MKPGTITDATGVLKAPADWDEASMGPCDDLHVRIVHGTCASAWQLDDAERTSIALGAHIVLTVHGNGMPPVSLSVETDDAEQSDGGNIDDDANAVLRQLFLEGPTSDGGIISKAARDTLIGRGVATRIDGWTALTTLGLAVAVKLGLGADKHARDNYDRAQADMQQRAMAKLLFGYPGRQVVVSRDDWNQVRIDSDIDGDRVVYRMVPRT